MKIKLTKTLKIGDGDKEVSYEIEMEAPTLTHEDIKAGMDILDRKKEET